MSLSKPEFTNAGKSMLGRAQNTETLNISKIVVGSGVATQPSDLWPLTALIAHQMDVVISRQVDDGNGTLLVEGSLRSDQAPAAFNLCEVGVMAHIGAEADSLYSVGNVFTDPPDHIDPAAPTIQVFKLKLIIDRIPTGQLNVSIGPSENVIGSNIGADTVGAGVYRDAAGNVLNFKRLVAADAIVINDLPDTITIGQPFLPVGPGNHLDLYVPLSYPGITDPNVLFPTIMDAHNYLLKFMIPTDRTATIHVAAGNFTGRLALYHPNGSQITLSGWARQDKAVSVINYVDAAHKNVAVASTTGLAVDQPVWLMCGTGYAGGSYITAVPSGTVATLATLDRSGTGTFPARPPWTTPDSSAGMRMSWCPTVLWSPDSAPWTSDEVLCACSYGSVQNLTLFGGYHALHLSNANCGLSNIMAMYAAVGITGDNIVLAGNSDIIVFNCDAGFEAVSMFGHGGNPSSPNFFATACGAGLGVTSSGTLGAIPGVPAPTGKIFLNHNLTCVRMWGGTLQIGNVYYSNNDNGFDCAYCGVTIFGPFSNYPLNNRNDLYAHGMGYIEYWKGAGAEPICLPIKNADGQMNAYIHV